MNKKLDIIGPEMELTDQDFCGELYGIDVLVWPLLQKYSIIKSLI